MADLLAYLVLCIFAGIGCSARSGWVVGCCMGGAYLLGRAYG